MAGWHPNTMDMNLGKFRDKVRERGLTCCSPWGSKESDTTGWTTTTTKIKSASHSRRCQVTWANWLWMFPNTGGSRGATVADRQASLKRALAVESRPFLHPHYIGHQLVMWSWASHCPSYNLCSSSVKKRQEPMMLQWWPAWFLHRQKSVQDLRNKSVS